MRKLNEKLIKQLANDDIAVKNTGTVEDLTEILNAAFPECPTPSGTAMFYKKYKCFGWTGEMKSPELPIHPVSDFFIENEQSTDIEEPLKWGEPVMCSYSENGEWHDGYIYVGKNPKNPGNHVVVVENGVFCTQWKFCKRQLPKPSFTRAEYAEKLGISIDQIKDIELVD